MMLWDEDPPAPPRKIEWPWIVFSFLAGALGWFLGTSAVCGGLTP